MNVLITLTSAGTDTGPFNLYSNVDNYTTAFETNISKGILVAGYTSTIVPPGTSAIRVKSMGICTNYVDITLVVPSTTTTTTTRASTTTTTTTAVPSPSTTTSTTTTVYVGPSTTTSTSTSTTTTTAYVGPSTTTTTSTSSTSTSTTSTSTSTTTTTAYVGPSTTTTTSTTTTGTPLQWYQITRCDTLAIEYSASYTPGTFALNDRVTDFGLNVYTVTATYSTNPGGSGLFLSPTGFTGCPGDITTTTTTTGAPIVGSTTTTTTSTTTTAAPVPAQILVSVSTVPGVDQDCLGTPYPVSVTTATATVYDQYGAEINAASSITVTINTTYNPCYGGSSTSPLTIVIAGGTSGNSTSWDSSRTVDCGGFGCLLETQSYDCAFSNTAGLAWMAPTITC